MGVPRDSRIKAAVHGVEAHFIAEKPKFKQTISTHKIMCSVFWDRQGVLLVEFLPKSTTINAA
jgi:hypothetical protein